jgi:tripartite ATP-independent transporter DctM subunit
VEPVTVIVLAAVFVALLALGAPVAVGIGLAALAAMLTAVDTGPALTTAAQRLAAGADSFPLLAIPFFILAGQAMNRGGVARRIIDFAAALVGWLPGGLAVVNVVSAMLFGAISGSAVAAASGIGGTLGPRMREEGYDPRFSAAVNVTSATTGLVIPPSNILIVYSLASGGVSIAALFAAGYGPGILVGVLLSAVVVIMAARGAAGAGTRAIVPMTELPRRTLAALPGLGLIVVVIGGILGGVFTATEAAAVAVVYALALGLFYRDLKFADLPSLLRDSARTTSVVLLLVATSYALSWVLSFGNVPQAVSEALLALGDNPLLVLLLINALLLIVGTFMDMTPAVLVFTPILLPAAVELGIDPIHFGVMMVLNLCVGLCTPPVGTVLFVGCGVANVRVEQVIGRLLPFYAAMVVGLLLVIAVPDISLALPRWLGFS